MLISISIGDRASKIIQEYYRLESAQIYEEDDPVNHNGIFKKDLGARLLQVTSHHTEKSEFEKEVKLQMNFEEMKKIFCQNNQISLEGCFDGIRKYQEEMDRCDGFQTLIDCDNCFGLIGQRLIQRVQEENPKTPFISFNILEETRDEDILNKAISMINISSEMIVPFYIPPSDNFSFFREGQNIEQQSGQLISNITLPYRLKENNGRFENFVQRMLPYKSCNIFNCHAIIPKGEEENILQHKQKLCDDVAILQSNYMEKVVKYNQKYRSFGESYMLRGETKIPENRDLNSMGIDIRVIDEIYSLPKEWNQNIFEDDIQQTYGKKVEKQMNEEQKEIEEVKLKYYPLQTCIFSNECQKYNLQNLLNQVEMIRPKTLNQFYKEDYTKDDLEQLKNEFQLKISNYGDYYSDSDSD